MISEFEKEMERLKRQVLGTQAEPKRDSSSTEESFEKGDKQIDWAVEASLKPVVSTSREIGQEAESPSGPVGIDIGTSTIVAGQSKDKDIRLVRQSNVFFTVPRSRFTKRILTENRVPHFELEGLFYIIGYAAEDFANMFSCDTRRPIAEGLLSPKEPYGINVMNEIIGTLIQKPKKLGETICFSIPGEPFDRATGSVVYHESMIKRTLTAIGYLPVSINEGQAVVMSELADNAFTGVGISMGGGMCNVCFAYLSVPIVTYSIQKAGDYVDSMAGRSVAESATKIKAIKEEGLDLLEEPKDRISMALQIFYDDVISSLVESMRKVFSLTDTIPKISRPVPIVLSGGTAMPNGCKEKLERELKKVRLPIEISTIRVSEDPLHATVKGALIRAMSEEE